MIHNVAEVSKSIFEMHRNSHEIITFIIVIEHSEYFKIRAELSHSTASIMFELLWDDH